MSVAEPTSFQSLGRSAARGGVITIGAQGARVVIQTVGIVVLARLLDPQDFGFVAMVVAVVGFGELVRDFGLSYAAIQAKSLSTAQRNNLFWINTGLGVLFGMVAFALAGPIAAFYDEPALADVTRWLSLTFVLNGAATQYRASLVRGLRFAAAAAVDVLGPLAGVLVAIVMGAQGYGYWALVGQELTKALVLTVGLVAAGRWLPGLPSRAPMRALLTYGANVFASYTLAYASKNVDTVVIGWRFGSITAGLYSRAWQLMTLPITQLSYPTTRVAMPVLSRLQDDEIPYRRFLLRGQTILLNVIIPVFALSSALAYPIIVIVLGQKWVDAMPMFQILAIGGAFEAAGFVINWLFQSKGATRAQLRFSLVARPLSIVLILAGAVIGPLGVAAGYTLGSAIAWPLGLWWAGRATGVPVLQLFVNGVRAIGAYAVAGVAAWGAAQLVPTTMPWVQIAVGVVAAAMVVGLLVLVWPAFRTDVRGVWSARKLVRRAQQPVVVG